MPTILEGKQVTRHFGGLRAVSNVDFHIDRGEIVGLIGPNGAGKTTLFNLISGAIKPSSGSMFFKGQDITGLKPFQICRAGVARTFQLVKIFPNLSVLENVLLGSLFGVGSGPSDNAEEHASGLLDFVELSAKKNSLAKDLGIASQKRIEVARALATKPELLLLDEVVAGLNPTEVVQFLELIKRIREMGITILMIEHIMKAIMGISDRVFVLHLGEKIADGTPDEVCADEKVIEVYLGK